MKTSLQNSISDLAGPSELAADLRPSTRIVLGTSVSIFGALLRVMSDMHYIKNTSVSDLCRKIVENVSSRKTETIGMKSLRNAIDNPEPEVLSLLLKDLNAWVRYTEKFIDRQRR